MSKYFPTLEEWLKQWCSERKYYKTAVGNDGLPKLSEFNDSEFYIINKMLRRKYK